MRTLVIVPAYNEQESIVSTIEELLREAPDFDYLIVNDGSSDRTRTICVECGYNMLDLPCNIGLTGGFQAGMKYAFRHGYDAAIQFDADGQHRPEYIGSMAKAMVECDADIVIGSRFISEKKSHSPRMIGSRLICGMVRLTTGKVLTDPTSGMRLFNRKMIEVFASKDDFGPEPDSIAYLMHHGAKVVEVQVEMRERQAGESYLNFARSIEYMLRTCVSILFVQWFR